jgi:hypothetical protein
LFCTTSFVSNYKGILTYFEKSKSFYVWLNYRRIKKMYGIT